MKITWRCPHCMNRNKWVWGKCDLMTGTVDMHCDYCAHKTKMYQDSAANFAAIDNIEDLLTVPAAKSFLESKGFIVKNAVTFV